VKIIFMTIFIIMSTSCATRQPKKIDINLYKQGLEVMELETPKKMMDEEKRCIALSPDISEDQPIEYNTIKSIPAGYKYNVKDLINLSVGFKTCLKLNVDHNLQISSIFSRYDSGTKGYFNNPYAYYTGYTTLTASLQCNNKSFQISSSQKKEVQRNKNFKSKEHESLVLAVIYLSFNSALLDIKNQVESLGCD